MSWSNFLARSLRNLRQNRDQQRETANIQARASNPELRDPDIIVDHIAVLAQDLSPTDRARIADYLYPFRSDSEGSGARDVDNVETQQLDAISVNERPVQSRNRTIEAIDESQDRCLVDAQDLDAQNTAATDTQSLDGMFSPREQALIKTLSRHTNTSFIDFIELERVRQRTTRASPLHDSGNVNFLNTQQNVQTDNTFQLGQNSAERADTDFHGDDSGRLRPPQATDVQMRPSHDRMNQGLPDGPINTQVRPYIPPNDHEEHGCLRPIAARTVSITQALALLPEFDGSEHTLGAFCDVLKELTEMFGRPYERFILTGVSNNLVGKAYTAYATRLQNFRTVQQFIDELVSDHSSLERAEEKLGELKLVNQGPGKSVLNYSLRVLELQKNDDRPARTCKESKLAKGIHVSSTPSETKTSTQLKKPLRSQSLTRKPAQFEQTPTVTAKDTLEVILKPRPVIKSIEVFDKVPTQHAARAPPAPKKSAEMMTTDNVTGNHVME